MAQVAIEREPADVAKVGAAVSLRQSCGLQLVDGERLLGLGPDYNAWFGSEGISFTPALGQQAPHDLPLGFTTVAIGRGGELLPVAAAQRSHRERTVSYERGQVVETYEVRPEGVKQSFVFHTLPQGSGDLVVRGAVTTELQPGVAAGDAMTWSLPDIGGVSITGVLGIDGAGRQVRGSLASCAGGVEFRLPASFVDGAVLPLVLDPLFGAQVTFGGATDDEQPEVAWDASTGRWLVVWQRAFSATNTDVRAQLLDTNAALVGGQFSIESNTATFAFQPSVANINGANAFIVAYSYGGDIFARGVDAATAGLTSEVAVATGSDNQNNVVLGGEAQDFAGGRAVAVWRNITLASLHLRTIAYNAGSLTLGTSTTIASGFTDSEVNISQSGGQTGLFCIVWTRDPFGIADIWGRVWSTTGAFVTAATPLASALRGCRVPAVDGDGINWVLAYAQEETTGSIDYDIVAVPVRYDSAALIVGTAQFVENGAGDHEYTPAVAWLANSALVAWADETTPGLFDTYVRSIDPFGCLSCEGTFSLGIEAALSETQPEVVAKFSSALGGRDAIMVWPSVDPATNSGDVLVQRWRAQHGAYTSLGGGCGSGGQALASCATNPNPDFRVRLRSGPVNSTVWGIIGFERNDYVCSPCTLIADPFSGAVWSQLSNSLGDVSLNLPIPTGTGGVQFYLQYVNLQPSCALGIETSSAIRVGIEN